jgi:hypothetical protein
MKKEILLLLLLLLFLPASQLSGQNQHLSAIDLDFLNYTIDEIKSGFEGYDEFKLINDSPNKLVYKGGSCFVSWPLNFAEYYFTDDSLYQIDLRLADTGDDDVFIFPEILTTFRNWYGNEMDFRKSDDGLTFYYWYFGVEMQEAEVMMFVCRYPDRKAGTVIRQVNLRRKKDVQEF